MNSSLTWDDHLKMIRRKISKSIGIITKIRRNVPDSTLIMLYHTLVQPYLEYCNFIWATDSSSSIALVSLFCKQKRAIRVISFSKWNAHTLPIFDKYRILTLYGIK